MLTAVLRHFPAATHPLILVHDPDQILVDETILTQLAERGYRVLTAEEPLQLHHALAQAPPFSLAAPLIVFTPQPVNQLPYTLWCQGHQVNLALHTFFPTLNYQVLKTLSTEQRWRLSQLAVKPEVQLGRQATIEFLLTTLFQVDWAALATTNGLVNWLDRAHQQDPLPPLLAGYWLQKATSQHPRYHDWPLADWLADHQTFQAAINGAWSAYVSLQTGDQIAENAPPYHLSFGTDRQLQQALPHLVQRGTVRPISLPQQATIPAWGEMGIRVSAGEYAQQRTTALLAQLTAQATDLAQLRWAQWQAVAQTWAELTIWRHRPEQLLTADQCREIDHWIPLIDRALAAWLGSRYSPLATQRLPRPHHLFHVPHFMAYEQRQVQQPKRSALLVMDGMSWAAWLRIAQQWARDQPTWRWQVESVLAQIPSVTAVSRQALLSGKRAADFAQTITHNKAESQLWAAFWAREAGLSAGQCGYGRVSLDRPDALPDIVYHRQVRALALIYNGLDDMVHGASQGLSDVHASLGVWLNGAAYHHFNDLIATLLGDGYTIYLTSDHGHCEAWGMGQPKEGLTVESRSKRARLYQTEQAAVAVQDQYPQTTLWGSQGVLPSDRWVLLPDVVDGRRTAFAPSEQRVVTHGGLSLDEIIVPLVTIQSA